MEERQMGAGHNVDTRESTWLLGTTRLPQLWRSVAGAAELGRLMWRIAEVVALHDETITARTITFDVPDWPGHLAGQHVDVRLTAADGYTAVRSYSIASAPSSDAHIEITVERLPNGE